MKVSFFLKYNVQLKTFYHRIFRGLKTSKCSSIRNVILRDSHMTANAFQRTSKNSNWCKIRNRFSSYNTHLTSMTICTHSLVLKSTKDIWSFFPVMFRVYVTILKYYCLSVRKVTHTHTHYEYLTNSIFCELSNLEIQNLLIGLFSYACIHKYLQNFIISQDFCLNYELTNAEGKKRTPSS